MKTDPDVVDGLVRLALTRLRADGVRITPQQSRALEAHLRMEYGGARAYIRKDRIPGKAPGLAERLAAGLTLREATHRARVAYSTAKRWRRDGWIPIG